MGTDTGHDQPTRDQVSALQVRLAEADINAVALICLAHCWLRTFHY
jgi:hypothetical protein